MTSKASAVQTVMSKKRKVHSRTIERFHTNTKVDEDEADLEDEGFAPADKPEKSEMEQSSQKDIEAAFSKIVQPKALKDAKVFVPKNKRRRDPSERTERSEKKPKITKDEENYIGYVAKDHHADEGYKLVNNFDSQMSGAMLDLAGDDDKTLRSKKNLMRWDNKKKKYVRMDANDKKKIKTESGVWIPASYKSDRYAKWKERSKLAHLTQDEDHDGGDADGAPKAKKGKKTVNLGQVIFVICLIFITRQIQWVVHEPSGHEEGLGGRSQEQEGSREE